MIYYGFLYLCPYFGKNAQKRLKNGLFGNIVKDIVNIMENKDEW